MTRKQNALNDFAFLWKKDDQNWIKKRKDDWVNLIKSDFFENCSAKEKKVLKDYFIEGKIEEYYPPFTLLCLTPYTTAEEVNKLFYSGFFDLYDMQRLMGSYVSYATKLVNIVPWAREHIKYFVDGILGNGYKEIVWKFPNAGNTKRISPDPTNWSMSYMSRSEGLFNNEIPYHGYMECLDYFISILAHATDEAFRRPNYLRNMLTAAESAQTNPALSAEVQDFARQICSRRHEIIDAWNLNFQDRDKILVEFAHLWKIGDPLWIKKRKACWKKVETILNSKSLTGDQKNILKQYYFHGKLDDYLPPEYLMLCTPYTTSSECNDFFYSGFFSLDEMTHLISNLIFRTSVFVAERPWARMQMICFIENFYVGEYKEMYWTLANNGKTKKISPDVAQWSRDYINSCADFLNGKILYHSCKECLTYFISMLAHIADQLSRRTIDIKNMLTAAESAQSNLSLSAEAQEFAKQVCLRRHEIIDAWDVNAHLDSEKVD